MIAIIRGPREKHPSGRPIRGRNRRERPASGERRSDEPLTAGLRRKDLSSAIGFVTTFSDDEPQDP